MQQHIGSGYRLHLSGPDGTPRQPHHSFNGVNQALRLGRQAGFMPVRAVKLAQTAQLRSTVSQVNVHVARQ
jgi:hypothetical protein